MSFLDWLKYVEEDLNEAKDAHERKKYRYACFFAQQSAEKFLKAFLVKNKKPFRKTHNVLFLLELCKEIDESFKELEQYDLEMLTAFASITRYPEFRIDIDENDAKEAIKIAEKVRNFVLKKLEP